MLIWGLDPSRHGQRTAMRLKWDFAVNYFSLICACHRPHIPIICITFLAWERRVLISFRVKIWEMKKTDHGNLLLVQTTQIKKTPIQHSIFCQLLTGSYFAALKKGLASKVFHLGFSEENILLNYIFGCYPSFLSNHSNISWGFSALGGHLSNSIR